MNKWDIGQIVSKEDYTEVAIKCNELGDRHIETKGDIFIVVANEIAKEQQIEILKKQLKDIDEKSNRSMRAILANTATEDDRTFLANLEQQAEGLRQQIKDLGGNL